MCNKRKNSGKTKPIQSNRGYELLDWNGINLNLFFLGEEGGVGERKIVKARFFIFLQNLFSLMAKIALQVLNDDEHLRM